MTPKWMPLDNSESLKKNVKKCNKHFIFNKTFDPSRDQQTEKISSQSEKSTSSSN
jgi:hypothetical protein